MDAEFGIKMLYELGKVAVEKEELAEQNQREEADEKISHAFNELTTKIYPLIDEALLPYLRTRWENIRELVFYCHTEGFFCDIPDMLPIYLSIETRNGISVEYLIPAIVKTGTGYSAEINSEDSSSVYEDFKIIQTEDPAKAVYFATERKKVLDSLQSINAEPVYEPIERALMVAPSLDDLVNQRIEEAIKKALA